MMKRTFSLVAAAFLLSQGCETLPTAKENSPATKTAEKKPMQSDGVTEKATRKNSRPVRPGDVTPGHAQETIKALQDELDAAIQ